MAPPEPIAALLAAALARSGDPERALLVAFVQRVLGCGCAPEIIRTAALACPAYPLRDYLSREGYEKAARRLNGLLGLPEETPWPSGPPWRWTPPMLEGRPGLERLALLRLRRLCAARADLMFDVPGRALFCLAVTRSRPSPPARLGDLSAAAWLVKELAGYNRVRLFTLSTRPAKPLSAAGPSLDAALTWDKVLPLLAEFGAPEAAELARLLSCPTSA